MSKQSQVVDSWLRTCDFFVSGHVIFCYRKSKYDNFDDCCSTELPFVDGADDLPFLENDPNYQ